MSHPTICHGLDFYLDCRVNVFKTFFFLRFPPHETIVCLCHTLAKSIAQDRWHIVGLQQATPNGLERGSKPFRGGGRTRGTLSDLVDWFSMRPYLT